MTILSREAIIDLVLELSPVPGLSPSEVESNSELLTSGLIDSLGLLQMVEAIEKSIGVTIPPEYITIDNFNSLESMASLQEKVAASKAA